MNWLTTSAGVKMPGIIYGTAWKKERTAELVSKALQAGFRGIDTACQPRHYNEPAVGEALRRSGLAREALYLQTKFTPLSSQDPDNAPYDKSAPLRSQISQSFEASKQNLQTDHVDCLILHTPLESHDMTMEAWAAMEGIFKADGALQLGISNCYDLSVLQALYADAKVKPAVLQNRFYRKTGYDAELRSWCANNGVVYQSFWSLTANSEILSSDAVKMIAEKLGKTFPQIFFRYLAQSGIVPLTGTSSDEHMKEDLAIFDFELSPDEMNAVSAQLSRNSATPACP